VTAVVALALLAVASWTVWGLLDRAGEPAADQEEYRALDAKLTRIEDALQPIAIAFTSETETTPIDLTSYRDRIVAARRVVESVNDVPTTSAAALEVRDGILTGGTRVLDGMDSALDALASDEATAAEAASVEVEAGLAQLDEARERLGELLGKPSQT
jgi:hypothetical protein